MTHLSPGLPTSATSALDPRTYNAHASLLAARAHVRASPADYPAVYGAMLDAAIAADVIEDYVRDVIVHDLALLCAAPGAVFAWCLSPMGSLMSRLHPLTMRTLARQVTANHRVFRIHTADAGRVVACDVAALTAWEVSQRVHLRRWVLTPASRFTVGADMEWDMARHTLEANGHTLTAIECFADMAEATRRAYPQWGMAHEGIYPSLDACRAAMTQRVR